MDIHLPENFSVNFRDFLRKLGYATHMPHNGRLSFIRRLLDSEYPRFHIYIEKNAQGRAFFTLHLDQKKPSYESSHAHSGEYNSPTVLTEGERIRKAVYKTASFQDKTETEPKKNGWMKRWFG